MTDQAALRAVLFDFDGTLSPSLPLWIDAYGLALTTLGLTLTRDEIRRRCLFRDWDDVAADLGVCNGVQLQAHVDKGLQQAFLAAELFPQVREIVEECRAQRLQTALVTSAPRHLIDAVALRLDVHHLFDFVICGDEVKNFKPHPEPLLRTLTALDCAPHHAIMIGDSTVDILAGKAAGTRTALFMPDDHHHFHDGERLRATQPDFIFNQYSELRSLLGFTGQHEAAPRA